MPVGVSIAARASKSIPSSGSPSVSSGIDDKTMMYIMIALGVILLICVSVSIYSSINSSSGETSTSSKSVSSSNVNEERKSSTVITN